MIARHCLRALVIAALVFAGNAFAQGAAADKPAAAQNAAQAASHKCNFDAPARQGSAKQAAGAPMNILLVGASGMIGSRVLNDWTFFSPAASIAPGKRTGKYQLGTTTLLSNAKGESSISAEDYAHALVDELEKHARSRQQMTIAY